MFELRRRICVVAEKVYFDNRVHDTGLPCGGVCVVLDIAFANARQDNFVTDCKALELRRIVYEYGNHAAVFAEEIEPVLVNNGRTNDTAYGNHAAVFFLVRRNQNCFRYGNIANARRIDIGNLKGFGIAIFAVRTRNGNRCITVRLAVQNRLAVFYGEFHNVGVARSVGKGCVFKTEKFGRNARYHFLRRVCVINTQELIHTIILNRKFACVVGVELIAFVHNLDRQETRYATARRTLVVDYGKVNGANFAVKFVNPSKVVTVALRIGVATRYAVNIIKVVVDEAVTVYHFYKRVYFVNRRRDVFGKGGIHNFFHGRFFNPRSVEIRRRVFKGNYGNVGKLVTTRIAVLCSRSLFGFQNPEILFRKNGNGVTNRCSTRKVYVINVNGVGFVHEIYTAGFHTVRVGDLRNYAVHLNKLALFHVSRFRNRHFGIAAFVDIALVGLEFDKARVLNFFRAVVVLQNAVQQHFVALNGSFR